MRRLRPTLLALCAACAAACVGPRPERIELGPPMALEASVEGTAVVVAERARR